jgi:hypothetical protein
MSKTFQQISLVVLVVLAINGVWQFAVADVEPAKVRQAWEMKYASRSSAEKFGDEGWELVAVDQGVLYFKRPK